MLRTGGDDLAGVARRPLLSPLLRATRPRQWVKNLLVLAAPIASGRIVEVGVLTTSLLAVTSFCLAAAGVYLVNDVRDAEVDRQHPTKRFRPVAAGELAPRTALIAATLLVVLATVVAGSTAPGLLAVVVLYVALSLAYDLGLKAQPVVDLAIIAAGFVLRALAGGVATDIRFSPWFLLVVGFASLFVAAGKRSSELQLVGEGRGATRSTLAGYTTGYLRFVWALSATVAVVAYCLWAIDVAEALPRPILAQASIVPFVFGVLRYAMDVDRGRAEAPEDVLLGDRVLAGLGLVWVVLFIGGVLGG